MKKAERIAFDKWVRDNNIDYRTLGMIIHHYISIGENTMKGLTPNDIQLIKQREERKQAEAEARGAVYLITPEFTAYLLTACMSLSQLNEDVRYAIIKEYL